MTGSTRSRATSQGRSGRRWLAGLGLTAAAAAALFALAPDWLPSLAASAESDADRSLAGAIVKPVVRSSFEVSVPVQGNLDSQSNVTLSSEVEGSTTIISIVPEGKFVQPGDLVVELDSSELREDAKQQEIDLTQARAKLSQAEENLEIQRTQNLSDIAAAELEWKLSILDLEKYREGEYPQQEKELSGEVALAEEESLRAVENYEFSRNMVKKGYKTPNEAEADRIAVRSAELKLQQAREKLKVLTEYTRKREIAELTANATEFERELERVKLKAKAAEAQAEAEFDAAKLTFDVEQQKLERSNKLIEACQIYAPQAGEVVYANDEGGRRSEGVQIEEGAQVRERQAIVKLPDTSQMQVESRIHESLIGRIREGLPAIIRVDAYPDRKFSGRVGRVSSVPMSGRFPNYDLREYETDIFLTGGADVVDDLRPGLTAQIKILVDQRDDVLQVPQQAVVRVGSKKVAFVDAGGTPQVRYLELGSVNDSYAEVLDGLAEGDRVVLNPKSQFPDEILELQRLHAETVDVTEGNNADGSGADGEAPGGGRPTGKPDGASGRPTGKPAGAGSGKPDGAGKGNWKGKGRSGGSGRPAGKRPS